MAQPSYNPGMPPLPPPAPPRASAGGASSKLVDTWRQSYSDMPFDEYARRVHRKFYSDMPFDEFATKAGAADALSAASGPAKGVTLNIGGRRVKVGPEFSSLSPEQQDATVDEIAHELGISPGASQKPANKRFEIQGPDGRVYEVEGPTMEGALKAFRRWKGLPELSSHDKNLSELSDLSSNPETMRHNAIASNPPSKFESALRGVGQGLTLGFGDEIGGFLHDLGLQGQGTDEIRRGNEAAQQANPVTYGTGEVGGMIGGAIATPAIAPIKAGLMGGRVGAGLAGAGNAAIEGAALSGIYGAGAAEGGIEDRALPALRSGAVGGLVSAPLGGIAGRMAARSAAPPSATARQAVLDAAQRQGLNIPRAAATDSTALRMASQGIGGTFVGAPIRDAMEAATQGMGTRALELASQVGAAGDRSMAGGGARAALTDYIKRQSPERVSAAYDAVDALVDPMARQGLSATAKAAQEIAARRQAAGLKGNGGAVDLVADALSRPGGLTYSGIKDLRTNLGEQMKSGMLPANFSGTEAKRLYAALSDDLKASVAATGGQEGRRAFEVANRYSRMLAAKNKRLEGLIGNKSDEQLFETIIGAAQTGGRENARILGAVRMSMPAKEWKDLSATLIGRLGRDGDGNFSPARFLTDYGKLSDAGRNALFDPATRGALNDLQTISRRLQQSERLRNFSNTGNTVAIGSTLLGIWASPFTAIGSILGGNVAARILAKPARIRQVTNLSKAIAGASKARKVASGTAIITAARSLATSLAADMGQPKMAKQIEDQLVGSMASAGPSQDPRGAL